MRCFSTLYKTYTRLLLSPADPKELEQDRRRSRLGKQRSLLLRQVSLREDTASEPNMSSEATTPAGSVCSVSVVGDSLKKTSLDKSADNQKEKDPKAAAVTLSIPQQGYGSHSASEGETVIGISC